jgi:hypothetical protein
VALLAFRQEPAAADLSLRLDAAPDGISDYHPSTGTWDSERGIPAWLAGNWQGQMTQPNSPKSPYSMRVAVSSRDVGKIADVSYPDLACGGVWKLANIQEASAEVYESITYGNCINGIVSIKRLGNGSIDVAFYESNVVQGQPTAWATLSRP